MDHQRAAGTTVGLELHQQKYLPARAGEQEMHAIVTIRVDGPTDAGPGPALAEILVVDCSTSMTWPQEKFRAAKNAAAEALRMLPDGTPFAVVQGTDTATVAYPGTETMHQATPAVRRDAERAVRSLIAAGGTSIGTWLDLSRRLLAGQPAAIRHVLLLTDGRNEHDDVMPLAEVLDACDGRFVCDAWGIGDDWDGQELLRIAGRLHGSANAVREESALAGEYRALMGKLLTKSVPELVIRVAPSPGSTVRYLKQVHPTEVVLSPAGSGPDGRTAQFTTRAWGSEVRRYHLCLTADAADRPRGADMQLAAVSVEVPDAGEVRLPVPKACVVHWTDDPVLSQRTDESVAHFRMYQQLGQVVVQAAEAYERGVREVAERHLATAVRLADLLGDRRQLDQLMRLVDIDSAGGRVRLRPDLSPVDFQHLITASSHSTFGPVPHGLEEAAEAVTVPCPACGEPAPAGARFCTVGGHRMDKRT